MTTTERYMLTRSEEFTLGPNEEARVDLKLKVKPFPPRTKVTGKVYSDGRPLMQATVKILNSSFDPVAHVLTNSDGGYLFANLPPGNYKVTASAQGYKVANVVSFALKPRETVIIDFSLKADQNVRHKNFVYGRVTEFFTQVAIADAEIKLFSTSSPQPVAEVCSNEDGQYLFCAIAAGEYVIVAGKHGFITGDPVKLMAGQGQLIRIDFQLHPSAPAAATVSGVITDDFCPDPVDVWVGLFSVEPDGETLVQIKTTVKGGVYLFTDVPPGEYVVKAKIDNKWGLPQPYKVP